MKKTTRKSFLTARAVALLVLSGSFCPAWLYAQDGSWNYDGTGAGNWTDPTRWTGSVPNSIGATASFTNVISAARSVSLNGVNQTIGTLNLGDSTTTAPWYGFTISSGSPNTARLIFDQTGVANAVLNINNFGGTAKNTLSPFAIQLNDNLAINANVPNTNLVQLTSSSWILENGGSYGITKNGPGIVELSGPNTFSGGIMINGGRLDTKAITAFGLGSVTVASGGQANLSTSSSYGSIAIAGNGYLNSNDPLAQAGALRFANKLGILGNVTVSAAAAMIVPTNGVSFITGNLLGSGNLQLNGNLATNSTLNLMGTAAGYSGLLSLGSGNLNYFNAFGGSLNVAPVAGGPSVLGAGSSLAGSLGLDSTAAAVSFRNLNGPLAITGNLNLTNSTAVLPATFPVPGTGTLTLMTYAALGGSGTLTFDPTGYRGSPVISVGATAATITGLDGRSLTWNNATTVNRTWDVNSSANWTGGDTKFFSADAVIFGNTGAGFVTNSGILKPQSITFNNTVGNDYTLTNGLLDGVGGGIVLNGGGIVTLGSSNNLTGPVTVNQGRLKLSNPAALGFTPGVTVASGAGFDINGQKPYGSSRYVDVTIAGNGDGTVPALGNNGANIAFGGGPATGVRNVTLSADATIGGTNGFDIDGVLNAANHKLTKTGAGALWLVAPAVNLTNFDIAAGSVGVYNVDAFGTHLRIETNASVTTGSSGKFAAAVTLASGGAIGMYIGALAEWTGPITAEGNVLLQPGASTLLVLDSDIAIPGNLTVNSSGTARLMGNVTVGGALSVASLQQLTIGDGTVTNTFTVNGLGGTGSGTTYITTNATLAGTGTLAGNVIVNVNGTIAPGSPSTISTLSISNLSQFFGNVLTKVNKALTQSNDLISASGTLTCLGSGTLTMKNIGTTPIADGDVYHIFNKALTGGSSMTVTSAPGTYAGWVNNLAVDGTVQAVSPLLSNLTISPGAAFSPAFSPTTFTYYTTADFGGGPTNVTVTPTAAGAGSTITVNGNYVASGTGQSITLDTSLGLPNVISNVVTAADGVTTVTYVVYVMPLPSLTPPTLTATASGANLNLTWPADHTGYRLLSQTNHLVSGISSNPADWGTLSASILTNAITLPLDKTSVGGYYRLVYP